MAEQFTNGSIAAPGFYGLNLQDSSVQLSSGFALKADNCIIDKYGRIGARKGWDNVNTSAASTGAFKTIFEFVKSDTNVVISAANNNIYTGTSTLTAAAIRNSNNTANLSYTITDDNWQIVGMPYGTGPTQSAHAVLAQAGHEILIYHKLGTTAHAHTGSYGFQRLGDISTLPAAHTTSSFKPNCVLSAYGRLWAAGISGDTQTVYFSDLQDPSQWQTGTSGYLDISAVIQTGDPITALASYNGFLIIFCRRHIIIYRNASDPTALALEDIISGVGCTARDSVASVAGTDILFLSETGVQSLQRIIQEKSLPFRDVSKNVRDTLLADANSDNVEDIKAVYYATDAFYLLSIPGTGNTYCFDTRGALESGASRATVWRGISPTAFCVTEARDLYLGQPGYIGRYTGYDDNGTSYRMAYYTNYFDMEQPSVIKILKKVNIVSIGGSSQALILKWSYDYTDNYKSGTVVLDTQEVSEYGIAEYNIGTYNNGIVLDTAQVQTSGSGKVVQLGFESEIDGSPLSVQKIDFSIKLGKNI